MENRTEMVGGSLTQRIRQAAAGGGHWVRMGGAVLAGYVMSSSFIFGGISPFGVACCAAVQWKYALGAALGAVLGYLLSAGITGGIKYLAAVALVLSLRWLAAGRAGAGRRVWVPAAVTALALGAASAAVLFLSGQATMYDVIFAAAEVFLGGGSAYFFTRAVKCLRKGWDGLGRSDFSCLAISFSILVIGLAAIRIGGLSMGRVLAVLAVLLCARYGAEAGGAVSGVTAGIALGLAGGDFSYVISAYGFGGLVAGMFGGMGRIATAASFICVNTVAALFTKDYTQVYVSIFEIFAASLLFVALPSSVNRKLRVLFPGAGAGELDVSTQTTLRERMGEISAALGEIGETTRKVSEKLGQLEGGGSEDLGSRVADRVCKSCGRQVACWQMRYSDTMAAMSGCMETLKKQGSLAPEDAPEYLAENCCRLRELTQQLDSGFHDYIAREGVQIKVSKVRSVVTDQFEGLAMMMDELSRDLCGMKVQDPAKTARIREYLRGEGLYPKQLVCYRDASDRQTVEMGIPHFQLAKVNRAKTALDLSALLDVEFDLPQVTEREEYTALGFTEKAAFTVELGAYQIACGSNRLCGDAYDYIRNRGGKAHFVLSDGMGCGGNAAVDSAMASGLITRLLSVGVGHEAALKMVNSALLIKSGEESLATIDICTVDLFSGRTDFYKAGAAPTFLVKNGKAGYLESTSLPAGILRGVAFEKSSITLRGGDMVLLVSDGVVATGADWLKSELESLRGTDLQRMCEKLALTAKLRRADGREDDITVVAVALRKSA